MNDYKELCETLRLANSWQFAPKFVNAMLDAADAIEQLVKERDADVRCAVEQMPTVDAVEVVRCRDCKWYHVGKHQCEYQIWMLVFDNDFCSYGERKEVSE